MTEKIQLTHPQGKKAISMDKKKYEDIQKLMLKFLKSNKEGTYTDLLNFISKQFTENNTKFEGSLEWHLEWVKLDLESKNQIKRIKGKREIKYSLI